MFTSLFWGLLVFGLLLGGFVGGFNWKRIKGGERDQVVVRNRIILFALLFGVLFGIIGFFLR